MRYPIFGSLSTLCRALGGAAIVSWLGVGMAIAQETPEFVACPAPAAGEYLLLTIVKEEGDQDTAIDFVNELDNGFATQVCSYLGETVVRISGFGEAREASDLARSLTNDLGLSAFVTRLPEEEPIEPQFEPRPYGEALELPEVQVVEARPASGRTPASTPEATEDSNQAAASDTDESNAETDNGTGEDDLPVFTPADMPPPQTENSGEAADASADSGADSGAGSDAAESSTTRQDSDPQASEASDPTDPRSNRNTVQAPQGIAQSDRVQPPAGVTVVNPGLDSARLNDGIITPPFNPQPLADGYAVLVDYFNDPSVAVEVAAITGQAVGLVSYGQRPFLMADFSQNEVEAKAILDALNEAGLWPMLVDSRRAILLTPRVQLDR